MSSLLDQAPGRARDLNREGTKSFRAHRTYDKLAMLVGITVVSGAVTTSLVDRSPVLKSLFLPMMFAAMGLGLVGTFKPHLAKTLAPIYALVEGAVLGVLSKFFAGVVGKSVIPTAVIITSALFVGCLLVFRTGIVKVTPKFVSMVGIASLALFAAYMAALVGLRLPGIGDLGPKGLIFGVIGLGIALSRLFIDFDRVQQMETNGGMSDSVEWFLALQLMLSLVMVYVNVLRILASSQRRR
jgi:uncharacterized YccA/Bax inhibitor family protein